jgi:hypothetical protein
MTWNNGIDEDLIYNYEIGLSSTTRNRAPDIYAFSSSKHHKHCQLRNPNLVDGKEFYVVIKTIGQSGMRGYQVNFHFLCIYMSLIYYVHIQINIFIEHVNMSPHLLHYLLTYLVLAMPHGTCTSYTVIVFMT